MRMIRRKQRLAALTAAWMLAVGIWAVTPESTGSNARAEGPAADAGQAVYTVEEKGLTLGESSLTYPSVSGLEETLNQAVNDRIAEDLGTADYLTRMSQLISGGRLTVGWDGGVCGDVFSAAAWAEGAVESARPEFVWTWSNIDLRDGHEIGMDELFSDPAGAREEMERILEEEIAPELSAHLGSSGVTPLPEGFRMEKTGLTLLYKAEQLSTLSDRAGAVKITWDRLVPWMDLSEDGIAARIGAADMIAPGAETREAVARMVSEGQLTDVPARIGDGMLALTEEHHLLMDPEVVEGVRLFALEGAAFQNILLETDYLSEDWDGSVVQGMRAGAGCWHGLVIGRTGQAEWEALLGAPDNRVTIDEERAEYRRGGPGTCDYYRFGEYQLQLYADEAGVLWNIAIME